MIPTNAPPITNYPPDHSRAHIRTTHLAWLFGAPPVGAIAIAVPVSLWSFWGGIALIAFALGWTVIVGPCGCAHVGAFTSTAMAEHAPWLLMSLAYLVGGLVSGAITGGIIGALGMWTSGPWRWVAVIALAFVALARETGLIPLPLFERRRQTHWKWFSHGPSPANSVMWGLDVGLVFATWLTFAGAWVLAAVAFVSGSPLVGSMIFAVYWLGRAIPHWIDRGQVRDSHEVIPFVTAVRQLTNVMRWIHVAGLATLVAIIVLHLH